MRPRLWHRWFLLSAGLVLLALVALLWAQASSFERGLLGYARTLEQARVPEIADRLATEYRVAGSWVRIERQPRRWLRLIRPGEDEASVPPPRERLREPGLSERSARDAPRRPPPATALDFVQRITLLDAQRNRLRGPPPPATAFRLPIEVDGQVVGELALAPMPELYDSATLDFVSEQRARALWIAFPVLLLASLASWAFSRLLLRRLGTLALASRRLASGDYRARVGSIGEDELGELAIDFDRMAESLQRAQQSRDRWIADISHELRTPLTILRGELHALQDGVRPFDAVALTSLLAEGDRLARRIDDLYALALSDSGGLRYRFERMDFSVLVSSAVESRRTAFADARLTLLFEAESSIWLERGDAVRLEQLLENLLGNALRYTSAGGEVRVTVLRDGAIVRLQIEDSAPGVATDEIPLLLDRHFRASGARPGGAGLGLAICRNIIEAHGGGIALAHSMLGGLSVQVWLPISGGAA